MNLIEQLGGYEEARNSLQWVVEYDDDYNQEESPLYKALLDYRRANNIFEPLDKVVYVDDFMHDEISVVSNIEDRVWLNSDAAVCIKDMVRHATDAEIQAGHRLPTCEVLDEADIPTTAIILE